MSWTSEPESRKVTINGAEVEFTSPAELRQKVLDTARSMGLARFDVYINGSKVSPNEFDSTVASIDGDINIEIVSADKAA